MVNKIYNVAGHSFEVVFNNSDSLIGLMHQYECFEIKNSDDKPLFTLLVNDQNYIFGDKKYELGRFDADIIAMEVFAIEDGSKIEFSMPQNNQSNTLDALNSNRAYLKIETQEDNCKLFALNNALMLLYALYTTPYNTLLVHASVNLAPDGRGYIFHAKSGTGKSTHNKLWIENIEGSEMLNDDNPVIRVIDGQTIVFGSPWSGKTPCYRNISAPIGAFVRIIQAPQNIIERLSPLKSYASILPSCSSIRWDKELEQHTLSTIEKIIETTPLFSIECLPNAEAAWLCYKTVSK